MDVINYSYARNNFRSIMEKVTQDKDEVIITSKDDNNVVVMAEETYNQLMETVYLLNNSVNVKHLAESIEQYNKEKIIEWNE